MNSHPLSMADCSEFLPLFELGDDAGRAWDEGANSNPRGWAPLVVVNPNNAVLNLLISVEWRVRFDVGHPAVSSHVHHGVTHDAAWDAGIRRATETLPGVVDIVEKVASAGMALRGAAAAFA
jgi:hypothetical protein